MTTTAVHQVVQQYGDETSVSNAANPRGIRGYGAEAFADPYGGGGPLTIARATAIAGQTVRLSFAEEPSHFSAASPVDGLNPSNYVVEIVSGSGVAPQVLGVSAELQVGPVLGVRAGEYGLDLYLSRPVVQGLRYRVTARRILARAGLGLGYPYAAEFQGTTAAADARPPSRRTDLVDFAIDPATNAWKFGGSGDVVAIGGEDSYRKRVIRRCTTPKNAFTFLPGYGTLVALKQTITVANVGALKTDLRQQILQEPETLDAAVQARIVTLPGILILDVQAKARHGVLTVGFDVQPDGLISVR